MYEAIELPLNMKFFLQVKANKMWLTLLIVTELLDSTSAAICQS